MMMVGLEPLQDGLDMILSKQLKQAVAICESCALVSSKNVGVMTETSSIYDAIINDHEIKVFDTRRLRSVAFTTSSYPEGSMS